LVFAVLTATALFDPLLARLALPQVTLLALGFFLQVATTLGTICSLLRWKYKVPISVLGFDQHVLYHTGWSLTILLAVTSVIGVFWCLVLFVDRPVLDMFMLPGPPRPGSRLEAIGRLPDSSLLFTLFYYVNILFLMPLMEEVLFRGFVWAPFSRRLGQRMAAVFAAGLWSLMHQLTPTRVLFTMVVGLIYAYLYQRTESLLPSLTFHVAGNTLVSLAWLLSELDRADRLVLPATVASGALLAICLRLCTHARLSDSGERIDRSAGAC